MLGLGCPDDTQISCGCKKKQLCAWSAIWRYFKVVNCIMCVHVYTQREMHTARAQTCKTWTVKRFPFITGDVSRSCRRRSERPLPRLFPLQRRVLYVLPGNPTHIMAIQQIWLLKEIGADTLVYCMLHSKYNLSAAFACRREHFFCHYAGRSGFRHALNAHLCNAMLQIVHLDGSIGALNWKVSPISQDGPLGGCGWGCGWGVGGVAVDGMVFCC